MATPEISNVEDNVEKWLPILYAESWRQYIHEDTQAQSRGTIFTAILGAIVALVGALSIQILKIPCSILQGYEFAPGLVILGFFWVIASIVLDRITTSFFEVTRAAHRYINVRGASLRIIDATAGVGMLGPSTFEDHWREKSMGRNPDSDIVVLPTPDTFAKFTTIQAYNFKGGFFFLYRIVDVLRGTNTFLRWGGVVFMTIGVLGTCLKLQMLIPLCLK